LFLGGTDISCSWLRFIEKPGVHLCVRAQKFARIPSSPKQRRKVRCGSKADMCADLN
jgi:hypothetical protein